MVSPNAPQHQIGTNWTVLASTLRINKKIPRIIAQMELLAKKSFGGSGIRTHDPSDSKKSLLESQVSSH